MTELLDSLDEQEAGDMLHYRTLFDEDEDFSQVTVSYPGGQAICQHAYIQQRWAHDPF